MYPIKLLPALILLAATVSMLSCTSSNSVGKLAGTVTVDDKPVETGTINFQSAGKGASSSTGAAVTDGKFAVSTVAGVTTGEYRVVLQAYRKTGRILNDPQRGKVPETVAIALIDSPKTVELTRDNASALKINFSTSRR